MSTVSASRGRERIGRGRRGTCSQPALAFVLLLWIALLAPAAHAAAPPPPEEDPFYAYHGAVPLADIAPGTVLKTRTRAYHVAGIPLPVKAVQLLYRSTGET